MITKLKLLNTYVVITLVALLVQSVMLVLFYSLPDPLGLSLTEMFSGKILWQIFMAFGAILVMSSIFTFLKKPRALVLFYALYFVIAIADYEVFRFSHQRLSYSFLRTYFHLSNITDSTTVSTLGGDFCGTVLWLSLLFLCIAGAIAYIVFFTVRKLQYKCSKKGGILTMCGRDWVSMQHSLRVPRVDLPYSIHT